MKTVRILVAAITGAWLVLATFGGSPALAYPRGFAEDTRLAPIKQLQRRVMLSGAKARFDRWREEQERQRKEAKRGTAARKPRPEPGAEVGDEPPARDELAHSALVQLDGTRGARDRFGASSSAVLAPNVRVNSLTGDAGDAGQAEASVAVLGSNVLIAWNDGQGFNLTPADIQGYGYSTDGGQTFTDGGIPPKLAGWVWNSDPVVTVNEKTGTFYYSALVDSLGGAFNGIGVVSATFSGSNLVWGAPAAAAMANSGSIGYDKEWIVADSTTANVYVSYTNFNGVDGDHIEFRRSPDGVHWTAATIVNTTGNGLVQGSRPAVGPNGEVYVVWSEIGPVDVDFFKLRKSTNGGQSWSVQATLPSYFGNFGAGAPGFNRERGVTFPSIAVDRSTGPNRGRIYVAWNESINFYDDMGGGSGNISEVEPNDVPGQATAFTVGNTVRGAISNVGTADFDFFKFNGTQGQTVVFFLDSLNTGLDLAYRVLCTDGGTRLAISNLGVGQQALIVFTLPTTGTYYLRPAPFSTSSTGGYRIRTAFSTPGPERARDHRDVFVSSSLDAFNWSPPRRVNSDPAHYDDWLPEVAVAADGTPYVIWYDWRDAPAASCGGQSNVYFARSLDGGNSWVELGSVTDATSNWTAASTNIVPNQGDYLHVVATGSVLQPLWADVRGGTPDIFTAAIPFSALPAAVSLVSVTASPASVSLVWFAPGQADSTANVYRRPPAGSWALLASTTVDLTDHVAYTDTTVTEGATYEYRLGVIEGGVEAFSAAALVGVPITSTQLAIESIKPNPTAGDIVVTFTLPTAGAAKLGLYDIGGRKVSSRTVGPGPGTYTINLNDTGQVRSGFYVLLLEQNGKTKSRRVTVVR